MSELSSYKRSNIRHECKLIDEPMPLLKSLGRSEKTDATEFPQTFVSPGRDLRTIRVNPVRSNFSIYSDSAREWGLADKGFIDLFEYTVITNTVSALLSCAKYRMYSQDV